MSNNLSVSFTTRVFLSVLSDTILDTIIMDITPQLIPLVDETDASSERLSFWFDVCLNNSLIVSSHTLLENNVTDLISNDLVVTPNTDIKTIVMAIGKKITAIVGPDFETESISITVSSSDTPSSVLRFSLRCVNGTIETDLLPETASELIGMECYNESPWWDRNDGTTYENIVGDDTSPPTPEDDPLHFFSTGIIDETSWDEDAFDEDDDTSTENSLSTELAIAKRRLEKTRENMATLRKITPNDHDSEKDANHNNDNSCGEEAQIITCTFGTTKSK